MDKLVPNVIARFKKKTVEQLQQVDDKGVHKEQAVEQLQQVDEHGVHKQQGHLQTLQEQDVHGQHDQGQQGAITRPTPEASQQQQAVAPPGWENTVKHMKKHKDIDNPWALAWYMKNKGNEPHKASNADILRANAELKVILRAAAYRG